MSAPPHGAAVTGYRTLAAPAPDLLDACVRCGACIQACPTHQELAVEPDDPRGRVFLIKAVGDGTLRIDAAFEHHIYGCLDCRACETACPMGVQVGRLIEEARGEIRAVRPPSGIGGRVIEAVLARLFPFPRRFEALARALWLGRCSGLTRLLRPLLPPALRASEAHVPTPPWRSARQRLRRRPPPSATRAVKGTVALLHGCVMNTLFADATLATVDVLERNGWRVVVPTGQTCCGALHVHEGVRDGGKALARRNVAAFEGASADYYLVNAAGCGSALKEYGVLLRHDGARSERAGRFSAKVRDASELLVEHGWTPPRSGEPMRVVYQDACHLAHAQRVRAQPRALLRSVPELDLVEMPDGQRCCGSAGIYNLTHPTLASALLARKVRDVPAGVDTLVTANPGCHMHIQRGLHEGGSSVRVRHLMDVLAGAYRRDA